MHTNFSIKIAGFPDHEVSDQLLSHIESLFNEFDFSKFRQTKDLSGKGCFEGFRKIYRASDFEDEDEDDFLNWYLEYHEEDNGLLSRIEMRVRFYAFLQQYFEVDVAIATDIEKISRRIQKLLSASQCIAEVDEPQNDDMRFWFKYEPDKSISIRDTDEAYAKALKS